MEDERALILQCLDHDLAAQRILFRRLEPKMHALCRRFAGNGEDAEDMLQNGFLRVFANLHKYRFEGSFDGWVRRIIVNTAISLCRQGIQINREVNVEQIISDAALREDAVSKLSAKDILAIIDSLPPGHWAVFNLHEIEGYDHKEIGSILGISEGTSKSQLHRAKVSIRRRMREQGMGYGWQKDI
ncbi:MAG: RNA polymerase sigma factor [Bacteroidota bacterium]